MSISYKDYYAVLGVSKSATKQEISKAYKSLARKHHPDLNKGDKTSEEKFKEINEAYEVLKDDEKRAQYDNLGSNWHAGQQFSNANPSGMNSGFSDFFESMFGGGGFGGASSRASGNFSGFGQSAGFDDFFGGQEQSLDKTVTIEVSLEDIARGVNKQISLQNPNSQGTKNLEVAIPEGIKNGASIRLKGQGILGRNGKKGDVYLAVQYRKHPFFTVEGETVYYILHCAPWVTVLGGTVTIPTLYGSVEMNIAPNTKTHSKLRLQGKGLGTAGNKGAQIVTIVPDGIPDKDSSAITKAWQKLRDVYTKE